MIVLEHYLKKQGMTQAELSRHTGISTSTVSDICRNRRFPTEAQHKKICEALGLDGSNGALSFRLYTKAWEFDALEEDPADPNGKERFDPAAFDIASISFVGGEVSQDAYFEFADNWENEIPEISAQDVRGVTVGTDPETLKDRFHMDFGEMLLYANDLRVWAEIIEDFCAKFEGMTKDELLSYKAD